MSEQRSFMKVRLIPEVSYRIETLSGKVLGTFSEDSKWEGIVKLVGNGHSLFVEVPSPFNLLYGVLNVSDCERTVEVMKGSPDLLTEIVNDAEEAKSQ